MEPDLILPSEIPWSEIVGSDLEELLYWLFDSMGAKDLEWRIGGKGAGAADQGRDLELAFFTPSPDGTLTKQIWWVEAKGRTSTVEPHEVHEAVLNAAGKKHVEVFVVATNANFSNPTRDWVKAWQSDNPRPVVKLWERTELEKLCSKNPLAVIRLHAKALSPQGKLEVASSKLWDHVSFTDNPALESIWKSRDSITIDERALFALIASELANGDIGLRSWALYVPDDSLISCLSYGLVNLLYLAYRASEKGVRQEPLLRAISYLIIVGIYQIDLDTISSVLTNVWNSIEDREYPEEKLKELILEPVLSALQSELMDVCTQDCSRVLADPQLLREVEIEKYWDRIEPSAAAREKKKDSLVIECFENPCKVGFAVDKDAGCPLWNTERLSSNIQDFVRIVDQVVRHRIGKERDA